MLKSLPVVSLSIYAPPAHRRASGAASGAALGRCAPPRAARAPPFPFLPNTEKLPIFLRKAQQRGSKRRPVDSNSRDNRFRALYSASYPPPSARHTHHDATMTHTSKPARCPERRAREALTRDLCTALAHIAYTHYAACKMVSSHAIAKADRCSTEASYKSHLPLSFKYLEAPGTKFALLAR